MVLYFLIIFIFLFVNIVEIDSSESERMSGLSGELSDEDWDVNFFCGFFLLCLWNKIFFFIFDVVEKEFLKILILFV